jgi:C1A family cysteine protease
MPTNWPTKDQGQRDTCVAFAMTACVEFRDCPHELPGEDPVALSEEFMHWAVKESDSNRDAKGTRLEFAVEAVKSYGYCEETDLPYQYAPPADDHDPPPENVIKKAASNRIAEARRWKTRSLKEIQNLIHFHGCVAVSLKVFRDANPDSTLTNWHNPATNRTGQVAALPRDGGVHAGAHAVALIGYTKEDGAPGGGWFVFRNSWPGWATAPFIKGTSRRIRSGYGTVSAQYLNDNLLEVAIVPSRIPGSHQYPYST